jgi:hypothetical protein
MQAVDKLTYFDFCPDFIGMEGRSAQNRSAMLSYSSQFSEINCLNVHLR